MIKWTADIDQARGRPKLRNGNERWKTYMEVEPSGMYKQNRFALGECSFIVDYCIDHRLHNCRSSGLNKIDSRLFIPATR
jgi:hypothetical protein